MTTVLAVLAVVLVPLAVALAALFAADPTSTRTHPHTADALRQLAERTPQTYDPWRNDGRPS